MSYPKQENFPGVQPAGSIVRSPLLQAIDQNRVDLCEEIISSNSNSVHEIGWNDLTPIHQVCLRGQVSILQLLLKHGASVNSRSTFGETPLHYASRRGDVFILHILIKAGSDVLAVDHQGRNCIHFAALGGSITAMHYLVTSTELQVDSQDHLGDTALHISCSHRHFILLDYLLRNNRLDPTIQNKHGFTALHLAAQMGSLQVVWKLLNASHCGLITYQNDQGKTAIDLAKTGHTPQHLQVVKSLEFYVKQPHNLPPRGPRVLWWLLLLLPVGWSTLVFFAVSHFGSYSGYFSLLMFAVLVWFVSRQQHRLHHPARWPNPVFVGAFVGGILQCFYFAYYRFLADMWPCYFIASSVIILFALCFFYLNRLLRGDPGFVRHSRYENGKPLSIADIASGRCKESEFCVFTELIRPNQTKYCKLCERLVVDLDHHCLFIGNCVARLNHRNFVVLIALVMILQVYFVYVGWLYMRMFYPNSLVQSYPSLMFEYEPVLLDLTLLCVAAFMWESALMFDQMKHIVRGETTYFNRTRSSVSFREAIRNLFIFFCRPRNRLLYMEGSLTA